MLAKYRVKLGNKPFNDAGQSGHLHREGKQSMSRNFEQIASAAAHNTQRVEELIATIAYATEGLEEAVEDFPRLHPDDDLLLWMKGIEIRLLKIRYRLQSKTDVSFP